MLAKPLSEKDSIVDLLLEDLHTNRHTLLIGDSNRTSTDPQYSGRQKHSATYGQSEFSVPGKEVLSNRRYPEVLHEKASAIVVPFRQQISRLSSLRIPASHELEAEVCSLIFKDMITNVHTYPTIEWAVSLWFSILSCDPTDSLCRIYKCRIEGHIEFLLEANHHRPTGI